MPIFIAATLLDFATRALVLKLMEGKRVDPSAWAGLSGQFVSALVTAAYRQDSELKELDRKVDVLGQKIDVLGRKLDAIPAREFSEHMVAGCRQLRDLPVSRRTKQDRRDLIRDARSEFVRASAIAENMGDIQRQAVAEVAIAGCWLWVPSIQDFTDTLDKARVMVETELLFRGTGAFGALSSSYRDVVAACKAYKVPAVLNAGSLIVSGNEFSPIPEARVAVRGVHGQRTWCAGVELMTYPDRPAKLLGRVSQQVRESENTLGFLDWASQQLRENENAAKFIDQLTQQNRENESAKSQSIVPELARLVDSMRQKLGEKKSISPPASDVVPALVYNNRNEWISVGNSYDSVYMEIFAYPPAQPLEFHVAPGTCKRFGLRLTDRPAIKGSDPPLTPTVGFLMSSRELTA